MYTCPHCGEQGLSRWQKTIMSPLAPAPCNRCGNLMKMTWKKWLIAATPGGLIMLGAFFVESELWAYIISFGGLALMLAAQMVWVPLLKADK